MGDEAHHGAGSGFLVGGLGAVPAKHIVRGHGVIAEILHRAAGIVHFGIDAGRSVVEDFVELPLQLFDLDLLQDAGEDVEAGASIGVEDVLFQASIGTESHRAAVAERFGPRNPSLAVRIPRLKIAVALAFFNRHLTFTPASVEPRL